MQHESRREVFAFLIIAITTFLVICLITHDPRDTLGSVSPLHNACGPVGAFVDEIGRLGPGQARHLKHR